MPTKTLLSDEEFEFIPLSSEAAFLAQPEQEGYRDKLYMPGEVTPLSKSGITVGVGVDLGQYSEADLRRMKIPSNIIDKVKSLNILGKRGIAAKQALNRVGTEALKPSEINTLSNAVVQHKVNELKKRVPSWNRLTEEQQRVALVLYYLYGNRFFRQKAYKQLKQGDWKGLYKNLLDFGDRTPLVSKGINARLRRMATMSLPPISTVLNE